MFKFIRRILYMFRFCRQMLRELIPGDLLKVQNSAEWKRTITAIYNQDTGLNTFKNILHLFGPVTVVCMLGATTWFQQIFFRYKRRGRKNYIFKDHLPLAYVRVGFLRGKTNYRTELSGIIVDRHQQTRHKSYTSTN